MKFSEYVVGQRYETKSIKLSKSDIMEFAKIYDPQYMHLDEEKAKKGRFGSLIASGMQTMNISFKLWIEVGVYGENVVAGTGMNHIQFLAKGIFKMLGSGIQIIMVYFWFQKKNRLRTESVLLHHFYATA